MFTPKLNRIHKSKLEEIYRESFNIPYSLEITEKYNHLIKDTELAALHDQPRHNINK